MNIPNIKSYLTNSIKTSWKLFKATTSLFGTASIKYRSFMDGPFWQIILCVKSIHCTVLHNKSLNLFLDTYIKLFKPQMVFSILSHLQKNIEKPLFAMPYLYYVNKKVGKHSLIFVTFMRMEQNKNYFLKFSHLYSYTLTEMSFQINKPVSYLLSKALFSL